MTAKETAPISSVPTTCPCLACKELPASQNHPLSSTPPSTTSVSPTTSPTPTPRIPTSLRHLHPPQLHLSVIAKVPAQISTLLITLAFKEWDRILPLTQQVVQIHALATRVKADVKADVKKGVVVSRARMNRLVIRQILNAT